MNKYDIIIVGGGAAGFFTAINAAENAPGKKILILERGKETLQKVRISGGGRCNVTHAEFIPSELVQKYPRGEKELLGPFHKFMSGDTIAWFEKRGVELKTEEDGRMFPTTDNSQTIIDCFQKECSRLNIEIKKGQTLKKLSKKDNFWVLQTQSDEFQSEKIMLATGSNSKVWDLLKSMGHTIIDPVPSLFTFNIIDKRIEGIHGISTYAEVKVENTQMESDGPLLITHWGMSGPAILKLSAWGARELNALVYNFRIKVNWTPEFSSEEMLEKLKEMKFELSRQFVFTRPHFELPKRLWQKLVLAADIQEQTNWADLNKNQLEKLALELTDATFQVNGKSTFKEEFVTAGGIDLKEVDFQTFESKLHKNIYFAGEILNIDAITGGFNFQNAWTGAYVAAKAMTSEFARF
ncbi:aminoacetone oxidase family FAD-binding enzyme [Christiangramia fulva]|uniref:Aminoacetone oxidase family FAD-binding enzyme n=1 Tax=Christiangramia fulva TaxID=2126553 RepID=A0A2R3ZAL9_9FLAO|nr:NAD(P)/FAD-dependent oxidoreductase [Christiangramia fulva]AVR47316.1 aminoacetone oxidase family FAD-binding enzyme [Christiangramia fulva]